MKRLAHDVANHFGFDIVRLRRVQSDIRFYDTFSRESLLEKRFYNIGAGKFLHPYWTNIDYGTDHYQSMQTHPFVNYDLMTLSRLPFESDSAEIIYSSQTIEHVSDEAVRNMIKGHIVS